ncbi:MAG TPA: dephospho-CoA kinase [Gemmatimonadales bacterium]|nr:dephospho-CoA kinase [Gemmatimonadales bacterium]
MRVAVTGNIASGKSTVARLFESWGAERIDADAITRELQQPGEPVFDAIVRRFGRDVLQADGTLDRRALRELILADPNARADLNAIVHPAVFEAIEALSAQRSALGARGQTPDAPLVIEIPLLFETGTADRFDRVVLVHAPRAVLLQRLMGPRGLDLDSAERFLNAQAEAGRVRQQSDFVIENGGSLAELEAAAHEVWQKLRNPA